MHRGERGQFAVARAAKLNEMPYSLLVSLTLVGLITAGLTVLDQLFALSHVSIVYLVPVVIAATQFGIVPAIVAAVAGVAASAFFFYPPIYSLRISNHQQLLDLPFFVFVAIVTGHLASNLRRQAALARERESSMRDLYAFSRKLARAYAAQDIYAAIEDHLSSILQRRVVLIETETGMVARSYPPSPENFPDVVRSNFVALTNAHGDAAATVFDPATGDTWLMQTISPHAPEIGLMAINLGPGNSETIEHLRKRVDAIWSDVAATLERLDLGYAIAEAKMRAEADVLRDALIGSVSHELKTPLASILGAATVLRQASAVREGTRVDSLATLICEEAERLNADIQNLLDASRINSDGVRPHHEWVEAADIVNAVLERRKERLKKHTLVMDLADELPLIYVDPVMIERALGHIVDNAAKYSDAGLRISITLRCQGENLLLSVADEGLGLTAEEQKRLCERFFRGRMASTVAGSGLGLWIAQAFVNANGGTIEACSPGAGRGTVISIHLPINSTKEIAKAA